MHFGEEGRPPPTRLSRTAVGVVGTIFSLTMFAFSLNYAQAVAARFLWGFLNGSPGSASEDACLGLSLSAAESVNAQPVLLKGKERPRNESGPKHVGY